MNRDHLREEYEQWAAQQPAAVSPQGAIAQPLPQPRRRSSKKGILAFLLIGFGTFLLLEELNFPIDTILDTMWPFLVVAAGVWLIAGQRNRRLAFGAMGLLAAVGLGFSFLHGSDNNFGFDNNYGPNHDFGPAMEMNGPFYDESGMQNHEVNILNRGFEDASLRCTSDAVNFNLEGMDAGRFLLSSNGGMINGGNYQPRTSDITLNVVPPFNDDAKVQLASGIPWNIDCNWTAGEFDADFSDVQVSRLNLRTDGGNTDITLPNTIPDAPVEITVTGGELRLDAPDDLPVRINVETSTGQIDVGEEFDGIPNHSFVSENWDEAKEFMDVNVTIDGGALILR